MIRVNNLKISNRIYEYSKINNQKITYEISDNNICFIVDYNFYKSYENDERHDGYERQHG